MLIKTNTGLRSSEVTDEVIFQGRRDSLRLIGGIMALGVAGVANGGTVDQPASMARQDALAASNERLTREQDIAHYNNYYEFSFYKAPPSELAQAMQVEPWVLEVGGLVENPLTLSIDDLLRQFPPEEQIRRIRCVEGWSGVVPWLGFPLFHLLKKASPLSFGQFVKFTSVMQPETMPNQRDQKMLPWPYVEGLRLDEAMHPLAMLAVGMYGKKLLNQNGAPIRLVIPWKYGFKSIKAIVKIEVTDSLPLTSWNQVAPKDYGFYANVNPEVPHPRWSQATERPLGSAFYSPRRKTELFNGYAEEVAHLYAGMDLRQLF
jgi:sulfoxide reductase catalytic subunit YedY